MNELEKEWLEEKFRGVHLEMRGEFDAQAIINKQILDQTTKTNGRVNRLEEKEENHLYNCPLNDKLKVMQEEVSIITKKNNTMKYVRNWIIGTIGVIISLLTMFTLIIKIIEFLNVPA